MGGRPREGDCFRKSQGRRSFLGMHGSLQGARGAASAKGGKSHNIPLAVIFIPAADSMDVENMSSMEPVIRAATAATGTAYLDLTAAFRAQPDPVSRLYLLQHGPHGELIGDGHLSREGNAVIGQALARWLVEIGVVP